MKLEVTAQPQTPHRLPANLVRSAAEDRAIEMARRADNDSRQGIRAIASSGEAIQHSFSPALVRLTSRTQACGGKICM
jgi:hypothetical protein